MRKLNWNLAKGGGVEAELESVLTLTLMTETQDTGDSTVIANFDADKIRVRNSRWVETGEVYGWEISLCGREVESNQRSEWSIHTVDLDAVIGALKAAKAQRDRLIENGGKLEVRR